MTAAGPLFQAPPRDPNERSMAAYRAARKAWATEVLENEARPEDWAAFKGQVRALGLTVSAGAFLTWIKSSWLATAHPDVRAIALREIWHRCDALKVAKGGEALSDPLPWETASLPQRVRNFFREQGGGFL